MVFGDSITHGLWDLHGGWTQRLRTHYDRQTLQQFGPIQEYPDIYNLGISGDIAEGLAKRLSIEMSARQLAELPMIVIAIGMNDTMIFKGVEANTPEMYKGELLQIIASARQFTDKILFVGLTAVDDAVCNPWSYAPADVCFNNARIWKFETTLREFCRAEGLPIVPVFETFKQTLKYKKLLADGLHPNESGHQLIADLVQPALDELRLS